jgi:predicted dehydrogenase
MAERLCFNNEKGEMMLNIGIIGAGKIVQHSYLPNFAPRGSELSKAEFPWFDFGGCDGGRVVSLCGKNIEEARRLANRFCIPKVIEDWHEAVNDPQIDAVCVATPNSLHAEITIAAAGMGKHVLVEKPMAVTLREADAMIEAADKNGVILMVDHNFRFLPPVEVAHQILQSGTLGRIVSIRSSFGTPGPDTWAPGSTWFFSAKDAGYGAMLDVGIHSFDLVRFLSGKRVKEVTALGGTLLKNIDLDDNSMCLLRFEDGALGFVGASWTSVLDVSAVVTCEKGLLQILLGEKRAVRVIPATGGFLESGKENTGKAAFAGVHGVFEDGVFFADPPIESRHLGPFQCFLNCILSGKKSFVSGEEGRLTLEAVLAGYRSMKEKRIISLPLES